MIECNRIEVVGNYKPSQTFCEAEQDDTSQNVQWLKLMFAEIYGYLSHLFRSLEKILASWNSLIWKNDRT